MDAMARPGLLRAIAPAKPPTLDDPYLETLFAMLCDSHSGFVVTASRPDALAAHLALLTYARPVSPADADFALVCVDAPEGEGARLIEALSGGSLLSPERSATVLFQCELLMYEATTVATRGFRLRGPGIAGSHVFFAASDTWYQARERRDDEFPCGIDFILFDRCGNVVCVPRTTAVESFGAAAPAAAAASSSASAPAPAPASASALAPGEDSDAPLPASAHDRG
jgi:alpha-D-ribose 1-methylphosphonate 5-triphosphate synthase subunit PhnH